MKYMDKCGKTTEEITGQDKLIKKMYSHRMGRMIMKVLASPSISMAGGKLLDSRISAMFIDSFIRKNNIQLREYKPQKYKSFNEFFTRQIKKSSRPIDMKAGNLISPSDGKISFYPIGKGSQLEIKHTWYSVGTLLQDYKLAGKYQGGYAAVIRLTVDDYHRYCYMDQGERQQSHYIPGKFYTVNPVANDCVSIYKENSREYVLIQTKNFGEIIQMEVGALMVGRIHNYYGNAGVWRGQEKGRFEFGGSTIIVLIQKDQIIPDQKILSNTKSGCETKIKMGQCIGKSVCKQQMQQNAYTKD